MKIYRFGFRLVCILCEKTHMLYDMRHPVRLVQNQAEFLPGFFFIEYPVAVHSEARKDQRVSTRHNSR